MSIDKDEDISKSASSDGDRIVTLKAAYDLSGIIFHIHVSKTNII